jgi:hypothetical protein
MLDRSSATNSFSHPLHNAVPLAAAEKTMSLAMEHPRTNG